MLKPRNFFPFYLITIFSISSSLSTMTLTAYKPLGHPMVDTEVERFIDVRVVINSPVAIFLTSSVHGHSELRFLDVSFVTPRVILRSFLPEERFMYKVFWGIAYNW